jgi:hypothetical protein
MNPICIVADHSSMCNSVCGAISDSLNEIIFELFFL